MQSFKENLETVKQRWAEAYADGILCAHDYLLLAADSMEVIEEILRNIAGDDAAFDVLVKDCEWLVQTYIVPIDLTVYKVPPFIERFFIDPQLVSTVRPLLVSLRPAPHKEGPTEGVDTETE